jgi:hypothetical protein
MDIIGFMDHEGPLMASREAEVEDVLAGPAGGAEDEESHVIMKTGQAAKT